ncbi:MAG: HAD-IA family hydrolase, partial [Anaerolineae bacterium]
DIRPRMAWERRLDLPFGGLVDLFFSSSAWEQAMKQPTAIEDVWREVVGHLDLLPKDLAALAEDFWSGDRLDEGLVAMIRDLRQNGVRTALLSNHAAELPQLLAELGVEDAFDVRVVSALEGVAKPDPTIFHRTLERLGVAPEDAVFVDDWSGHVEAARRMGIEAIRFRGSRNLRRSLAAAGLPVDVPPLKAVPGVRAVAFDWGGVILPLTPFKQALEWDERLGLEQGTLGQALWGGKWRQLEVGAVTGEEYDAHVAHVLDLPDREAVQEFYRQFYADMDLDPRLLAAARSLQDRYRVALLTNAYPGHAESVHERHGFDPREVFDVYINSAEVKLAKPDPAIYELVLDRLGVAPSEAIFLDDTVRNIDAARAMGMHGIVVADAETALADLEVLLGHAP